MKIDIETFKSLLPGAKIETDFSNETENEQTCYSADHPYDIEFFTVIGGWISNTLIVEHEGKTLKLEYQWGYTYPLGKKSQAELDDMSPETQWILDGDLIVVDEDGEPVHSYDLGEIAEELRDDLTDFDLSILGEDEPEEIDTDNTQDTDMEEIIIRRDNDRDIKFIGERIAKAASSDDKAFGSSYSGSTGRWTELNLYQTQSGRYICQTIGCTRWQGEHDRYSARICDTLDEVIAYFGHGWLAKELYENANIDATQIVE